MGKGGGDCGRGGGVLQFRARRKRVQTSTAPRGPRSVRLAHRVRRERRGWARACRAGTGRGLTVTSW